MRKLTKKVSKTRKTSLKKGLENLPLGSGMLKKTVNAIRKRQKQQKDVLDKM